MSWKIIHAKLILVSRAASERFLTCVSPLPYRIEGGELFDRVLDDKFILTEKACSIFMRQICEAMDYIHEHNIIHLDLKVRLDLRDAGKFNKFITNFYSQPENILCLTESGNRIKIIDFGLAREYDPSTKLQVLFGTPEFG